ncbi:hypothetical protein K402DRAFT_322682, partial [Aulographum hederae CBS 113979]
MASLPPEEGGSAPGRSIQERYLELNARLHTARTETYAEIYRPENTSKSYNPKQKEYIEWCRSNGFPDGEQLSEAKFILFFQDRVLNRSVRPKRRRKETERSPMEPAVRTPGITSMLKNRKMKEAQRKRNEFVDRGVGTLLDGYTEEELLRCVRAC